MDVSMNTQHEAVILVSCPDQLGLVAHVAASLHEVGCNILDAAQYTDTLSDVFIQRIHISSSNPLDTTTLTNHLKPLTEKYHMDLRIRWSNEIKRVAIFVSKEDHCLHDLLLLHRDGDLHTTSTMGIGQHQDNESAPVRALHTDVGCRNIL